MVDSIHELAFRKAAVMLSASGAEYAIVFNSKVHTSLDAKYVIQSKTGDVYGNLTLEKVEEKRKMRKARIPLDHTGYAKALPTLQPGEAWSYLSKDKDEALRVQASITAWASKNWGHKTYISTRKENHEVEILRLE